MARKNLDYYIEKYGEKSGRKRFNGVCKAENTKKELYKTHPHPRLSKEWYIWKYGEHEGLEKFNNFSKASAHTLENFVRLYGEKEGLIRYQDTISKKNTQSILSIMNHFNCSKEEAEEKSKSTSDQRITTRNHNLSKLSKEQLTARRKIINKKQKETKIARYGTHIAIDILRFKHPNNPEIIAEYKKKLFKTVPGQASAPSLVIIDKILDGVNLDKYEIYYGCKELDISEYKIFDHIACRGYAYDLTIIGEDVKIIFEYDGASFHATKQQSEDHPNDYMPATGKRLTYHDSYNRDLRKRNYPKNMGFEVHIIRCDHSEEYKELIIQHIRGKLI